MSDAPKSIPAGVFHVRLATFRVLKKEIEQSMGVTITSREVEPVRGVLVEELDLRQADPKVQGFVEGYITALNQYR